MKMFTQADAPVLAALYRMQAPEMKPLLTFFNKLFEDTKTAMITADDTYLRRLQGRAGVLKEFLDAVDSSASTLEKMR